MCERKCNCNNCHYCRERNRYERDRINFLRRSKVQNLRNRYLLEDSFVVLDDFIFGRLSLQEFEVELNVN